MTTHYCGFVIAFVIGWNSLNANGYKTEYPPWNETDTRPNLHIGILARLTRHACGPSRYLTKRIAVSHVNERQGSLCPKLKNLKHSFYMSYDVLDNNGNGESSMRAVLTLLNLGSGTAPTSKNRTTLAVLGPNSSGQSRKVSPLVGVFGVPLMSWASTDAALSNKALFPNFFRTVPPDSAAMGALALFMREGLGLDSINTVHTDSDFQTSAQKFFVAQARARELNVIEYAMPSSGEGGAAVSDQNRPLVLSALQMIQSSSCWAVAAFLLGQEALDVILLASSIGMMKYGWLWFGPDGLAALPFKSDEERQSLIGVSLVRAVTEGPRMKRFRKIWKAQMPLTDRPEFDSMPICGKESSEVCSGHPEFTGWSASHSSSLQCDGYVSFAFDAVAAIAVAFDIALTLREKATGVSGGNQVLTPAELLAGLRELVKPENAFECLGPGLVQFDVNQERLLPFNIVNYGVDAEMHVVAVIQDKVHWCTELLGEECAKEDDSSERIVWPSLGVGNRTFFVGLAQMPSGRPPPCPVGHYRSSGECNASDLGNHVPGVDFTRQVPCTAGTFQNEIGQQRCKICPAGKYSYDGASSCKICHGGNFSQDGASECSKCPPGRYTSYQKGPKRNKPSGEPACTACSMGKFAPEYGSKNCFHCPPTFVTLAKGEFEEKGCVCPEGKYYVKTSKRCSDCPSAIICPGGFSAVDMEQGLTDHTPRLGEGFMSLPKYGQLKPFMCPTKSGCRGYRSPFNASTCNPGYANDVIGCGRCQDGFRKNPRGDSCTECESSTQMALLSVGVSILANLIFILYLHTRFNRPQTAVEVTWGQAVGLTQKISVISSFAVDWPEPLLSVMSVMMISIVELTHIKTILPFDFGALEVDCWATSHKTWLRFRLCLPLLQAGGLFTLAVISWISCRPMRWDHVLNTLGKFWSGLFVGISSVTLTHFRCVEHPNGHLTLATSYEVMCFADEWFSELPYVILGCSLYIVSFIAYVSFAIYRAPKLFTTDPSFRVRYRFIFGIFTAERFYYSLWIYLNALVINLIQVLVLRGHNQLYILIIWVYTFNCLTSERQPFKFRFNNRTAFLLETCLIFVAIMATGFLTGTHGADSESRGRMATFLVISLFACYIAVLLYALSWFYNKCARFKGEQHGKHIAFGTRLRDVMAICCLMPNNKYNQIMMDLSDHDRDNLENAMAVLLASVCQLQPGSSWMRQRLIPSANVYQPATDEIIVGQLSSHAKEILHLNPWAERQILDRFMQQLNMWVHKDKEERKRKKAEQDFNGGHSSELERNTSTKSNVKRRNSILQCFSEKRVDDKLLKGFRLLQFSNDSKITKEDFAHAFKQLQGEYPSSVIEHPLTTSELDEVYELCDIDSSGDMTLTEFVATVRGMSMHKFWSEALEQKILQDRSRKLDQVHERHIHGIQMDGPSRGLHYDDFNLSIYDDDMNETHVEVPRRTRYASQPKPPLEGSLFEQRPALIRGISDDGISCNGQLTKACCSE